MASSFVLLRRTRVPGLKSSLVAVSMLGLQLHFAAAVVLSDHLQL